MKKRQNYIAYRFFFIHVQANGNMDAVLSWKSINEKKGK